ncbi:MAG TPA: Asp-tRNA(Asn)/Glu-tRNA(Gln) amidotransferase subunit GatA [Phycisphaerae bacterium]|nr:Asp-tRNA(Asn)/Glu-tRNA(Gln) amidotransferase subunit GatA [Phycisphaerae bacterium]
MADLTELSAVALRDAIAAGEASAAEATRAYLAAIDARDGAVCAYNQVLSQRALAQAKAVDAKRAAGEPLGVLAGVPVALKDNICTSWGRTTCSSKILADFAAPYDAGVTERLLAADAVILGKTNLDEFAMGSSTENSGFGPTRNPWDTDRVPGGSSGGSGAAVAARTAALALGSDTGGSIRLPGAFCGVVGMKPTYGRVSRYGLVAYGSSLDQIGPFGRDVADAALLLGAIAGHDPRDSTSIDRPVPDYLASLDEPVEGLRVGLVREFHSESLDPEVRAAVDRAADLFRQAGAEIVEVSLPHSRIDVDAGGQLSSYAVACYYIVAMAEASSNLARYDGVHYGHRTPERVGDIIDLYSRTRAEGFGEEVKRRVMLGTYALSSGYYDAYYLKALKVRRLIKNDFDAAFASCDVLLGPVAPETAFRIGEKTADPLTMYLSDIYTISANLAGVPAVSIPAGLSQARLPLAIQLFAGLFEEEKLLRSARTYERAADLGPLVPAMAGGA